MKIDMVFDYEMGNDLTSNIQELLSGCFQEDFPKNRIFLKQLPHFRKRRLKKFERCLFIFDGRNFTVSYFIKKRKKLNLLLNKNV
ncbi:hypothetical protein [Peribacillus sp. NPDC096448]|uniref:hypothetical protein n=1 Tax=Peribacillus sp. NPDC096448 TaxID=3364395 RepID=UPI00380B9E72